MQTNLEQQTRDLEALIQFWEEHPDIEQMHSRHIGMYGEAIRRRYRRIIIVTNIGMFVLGAMIMFVLIGLRGIGR